MKQFNEKQNSIPSKQITPYSITPPKYSSSSSTQKLNPKRNEHPINSSFQLSMIDNKQNISEDTINESCFVLNEPPIQVPRLSQANIELVQHLTESPYVSNIVISLTQINPMKKDIYGKIMFSIFQEDLYEQPFYFYYECDRIAQILFRSQKLFAIRNKLNKPNRKTDNINNNICFYINEIPPVESNIIETNERIRNTSGNKNYSSIKSTRKQKLTINPNDYNTLSSNKQDEYEMNTNPNKNKTNLFQVSPISTNMKLTYTPSITDNNNVSNLSNVKQMRKSQQSTSTNKKQFVRFSSCQINEDDAYVQRSPPKQNKNSNRKRIDFKNRSNNRNTSRNKKQEKHFPKETPLFNSTNMTSLFLTKIPKRAPNESNLQLDMAYSKAKDAARVVRRLEYSYNMKLSMMYSKPIHKKNAKIIQNWWRTLQFKKQVNYIITNIQRYIRGFLSRVSFENILRVYKEVVPFIKVIDKIISRRLFINAFHKLLCKYGILKIHRLIKPKARLIIKRLREFTKEMDLKRQIWTFNKKKLERCLYIKNNIKYDIKKCVCKIQAHIRGYLERNTEKGRLDIARKYHPYLYYYLKYGGSKGGVNKYKEKLKGLKRILKKIKEKNLKVNYNVNNCYEYLNYILKKRKWDEFKKFYYNEKMEMNPIKKKRNELKMIAKKKIWKDNKINLKKYFTLWKLYCKSYHTIIKPNLLNKFGDIWLIFLYHKKVYEQIFLYKLNYIKIQKIQNRNNSLTKIIDIYHKRNNSTYTKSILNYYFQKWKKIQQINKLKSVHNTLNTFFKASHNKIQQEKKRKIFRLFKIYEYGLKDSFHKWRFENKRYKLLSQKLFKIAKRKVLLSKRKCSLLKNISSLNKRKLKFKRKTFKTFQKNTGMLYRHYLTNNIQISFYHKNRKYFSLRKYRMLKYIINKLNNIKRINNWDGIKYEIFTLWKSFDSKSQLKKILYKSIKKRYNRIGTVKLLKFLIWYRKIKMFNITSKLIFLQKKIKKFLKSKRKTKFP